MISLCMIVRDEEEFIESCLEAAAPAVDEIVLVDTGSRDRTIEIARGFGAKVLSYAWNDDFSSARNTGLDAAEGDWILVLDADEIILLPDRDALRRACALDAHSGFFLPVVSRLENDRLSTCTMMRSFKNDPAVRFRFLIHEQVLPDLIRLSRRNGRPIAHLDVKILHKGYEPDLLDRRDKRERNDRIFQKQLKLYPRDLYSWYKYAEFLAFVNRDKPKLLDTLERAFELMRGLPAEHVRQMPFAAEIGAYLAIELSEEKKDPARALEVIDRCMKKCTPTPHLYFVLAEISKRQGAYKEAFDAYKRCLEFKGKDLMVPVKEGVTGWQSLHGMGICRLELGEHGKARDYFTRASRESGANIEPYVGLTQVAYREGELDEAVYWLQKLLETDPACAGAWRTGSDILARLGRRDQAAEWKKKAERLAASAATTA